MQKIWTPQPRQKAFQSRWEFEAFFGGAAGGGKSDALLAEALRQIDKEQYKGIIFRRSFRDLEELIDRSEYLYKRTIPKARFNHTSHVWSFPSGAKVYFGNISHDFKTNYQGKRYDFVGFDELTHFTYDEYIYLFSRVRPSAPGMMNYIRATGNPGGIGHGWVKNRFITAAPPETTIWQKLEIPTPEGDVISVKRPRIFIPSSVFDNKILLSNNPDYVQNLAMLPKAEREALLYGDWNSFSGQVFTEWRDDPAHYDDHRFTHVINPFLVPASWTIICGLDWGFSKPFSVGWYAVDHNGTIYRIREYYGCTGTPNEGLQLDPNKVAQKIKEIESTDPNLKGKTISRVADPAIFQHSTGPSVSEMMEEHPFYLLWEPGDNARIAGKMQYHYRLAFDENGKSKFYVFNTNKNFIRTFPNLVYSDTDVEDINTDMEDHAYDEGRYVMMSRPIPPREIQKKITIPMDDPLELYKNIKPYGM